MAHSRAHDRVLAAAAESFLIYCDTCQVGIRQRVLGRSEWLVHECRPGELQYLPEAVVTARIRELLVGLPPHGPGGHARLTFLGPSGPDARFTVRLTRVGRDEVALGP